MVTRLRLVLIALTSLAFAPDLAVAGAPPLEPVEVVRTIGAPEGGTLRSAQLAPDGAHLVVTVKREGRDEVGTVRRDGSGYRCLTCGVLSTAGDPDVLDDGRRLVLTVPGDAAVGVVSGGGGLGDLQYAVLECRPSLVDCDDRTAVPLDFPIDSITRGAQNREVAVHPDGRHVKWNEVRLGEGERMTLGTLVRTADRYVVQAPYVVNPGYELGPDVRGWIDAARFYESGGGQSGRSFWDGGRTLKYGTTTTALNYDVWQVDLLSGRRSQVTTDLDYNEMSDVSPDGRWIAASSARGLDRMVVFTELRRPSLLDVVAFGQIGRIGLFNNRRCMNERWLWHRGTGQVPGGYSGQPVVTEDGWLIRGWRFLPDGTGAVVFEERIPNESEPRAQRERTRIRELRFPRRRPSAPLDDISLPPLGELAWLSPYDTYRTAAGQSTVARRLAGPRGGSVTVSWIGSFAAGAWRVTYDDYSDDGRRFVSGTESLVTPNPLVHATWEADLRVSGAERGTLRGRITVGRQGAFRGEVSSEVDGKELRGVPTQASCPGVRQLPLEPVLLRARRARDRVEVRGKVVARPPEDAAARPVAGASVRVRGRRARTGPDGRFRVTLEASSGAPRRVGVTVRAGGFKTSRAVVRVR